MEKTKIIALTAALAIIATLAAFGTSYAQNINSTAPNTNGYTQVTQLANPTTCPSYYRQPCLGPYNGICGAQNGYCVQINNRCGITNSYCR